MRRPDALENSHPIVAFSFFVLVTGAAMLVTHPVLSTVSLAGSVAYAIWLNGRRAVRFTLLGMVPLFLVALVFNPLFTHAGATILAYFPSGNPLTLESIVFGAFSAAMIVTVITWFSCSNRVLTADKLHYLAGRIWPALALLFSMSLRFVPRIKAQIRVISVAQRGLGRSIHRGNWLQRARVGLGILSILVTWALENSIELADSMRSRGFGLKGRTSFHLYRVTRRDRVMLTIMGLAVVIVAIGASQSLLSMRIYPLIKCPPVTWLTVALWLAYTTVVALPLMMNAYEEWMWSRTQSIN